MLQHEINLEFCCTVAALAVEGRTPIQCYRRYLKTVSFDQPQSTPAANANTSSVTSSTSASTSPSAQISSVIPMATYSNLDGRATSKKRKWTKEEDRVNPMPMVPGSDAITSCFLTVLLSHRLWKKRWSLLDEAIGHVLRLISAPF